MKKNITCGHAGITSIFVAIYDIRNAFNGSLIYFSDEFEGLINIVILKIILKYQSTAARGVSRIFMVIWLFSKLINLSIINSKSCQVTTIPHIYETDNNFDVSL